MSTLVLPDAAAAADLVTFAGRARAIAPTGSVRLLGAGPALACYAGILDGSGLLGSGVVLGLRVLALDEPASCDITLSTGRLLDALAGAPADGPFALDLTTDPMPPRWAAQTPPRSGWEALGLLDGAELHDAARSRDVEAQVEGLPDGITHGVALALRGLGLLDGDPVLYRNGPWRRLSTRSGHVLTR